MARINIEEVIARLDALEGLTPGSVQLYVRQAEVGNDVADFLVAKAKRVAILSQPKKQLKSSSKQLKDIRKKLDDNVASVSLDIAPKHLWSVIQLIQQANHVYMAAGSTKYDEEAHAMVETFIRSVPNVWQIAKTIDEVALKKRELSGGVGNPKGQN